MIINTEKQISKNTYIKHFNFFIQKNQFDIDSKKKKKFDEYLVS